MAENTEPQLTGQRDQQLVQPQPLLRQDKQPGPIGHFFREIFPKLELYDKYQPYAKNMKIILQMLVGVIVTVLIILKALYTFEVPISIPLLTVPPLQIVGIALAFSSAIELAYTLFTQGPDEAVEPLITGLASVILLIISKITSITLDIASGVALLVLALVALFVLRYYFILEKGGRHLLGGRTADKQLPSVPTSSSNVLSQNSLEGNGIKDAFSTPSNSTEV